MGDMNHTVSGSFDPGLVILSYLVASLAAYSALDLGARVSAVRGWARRGWVVGGACAMGLGIWSMHFIGMLACRMPLPVLYDPSTVLLSLVFGVAAALVALVVVARPAVGMTTLCLSGLLMGSGIVAMHYTGMAAMRMPANLSYDPFLVSVSVVIAVAASVVALALTYHFRASSGRKSFLLKGGAGLIMGAAIAGMHYTGMAAARFHSLEGGVTPQVAGIDVGPLAVLLALMTVLILLIALLGAFADRRIWFHAEQSNVNRMQYESLFANNSDAIFSMNRVGRVVSVNPAGSELTGRLVLELVGLDYQALLWDPSATLDSDFESLFRGGSQSFELALKHRDQRRVLAQVTSVPTSDSQGGLGVFFICRDITEKRAGELRMHQLAFFDALTKLPNRVQLLEAMALVEGEAKVDTGTVALVMLDVEHFKLVNSSVGQDKGDRILVALAEGLQSQSPTGSVCSRVGSDEFAVFLGEVSEPSAVESWVQALLVNLEEPFQVEERCVHLALRIGYAISDRASFVAEALLKAADTALHHTKGPLGRRVQAFEPGLLLESQRRLEIEAGLRQALERGELEVHYQPQFDLQRRPIGAEALVRWRHPEKGLVSPADFIPVAEESGLIVPIGEWVPKTACAEWSQWRVAGRADLRLSVNLSTRQFEDPQLVTQVASVLSSLDFPAASLELEITESMTMNVDHTLQALKGLKALGLRISVDDFGTGYSSLSYLQHFPIDQLKIDQSFVRKIGEANAGPIVETIIDLAHHLQLDVLAEGVETEEQLEFLRLRGCNLVQGFLLSRPLVGGKVRSLSGLS